MELPTGVNLGKYAQEGQGGSPFDWLRDQARNVYSQHGEDGILAAILARIGTGGLLVECGAGDGMQFSNTRALIETDAYTGLWIEADRERYDRLVASAPSCVRSVCASAGPETTLDALISGAWRRREAVDLCVIDVDGQDYHLWSQMLKHRPRVVMVEFDLGAADAGFIPPIGGPGQAGLDSIMTLGAGKGYRPVCVVGCNAVFVDKPYCAALEQEQTAQTEQAVPSGSVRLNLGSGDHPLPGYVNVDRKDGGEAYPLAYADMSVTEVRASHLLEHFTGAEIPKVLADWVRVLKPGCWLRLAVPDFAKISAAYLRGEPINPQGYIMGGHCDDGDVHHVIFDVEALTETMQAAGLVDIRPWKGEGDSSAFPISLNLEGRKRLAGEKVVDKRPIGDRVLAVMSMPRLAFTDNLFAAFEHLAPMGIRVLRSSGVFWGPCNELMFEEAVKHGFDYVLAIDYDTVYTRAEVGELYRLMNEHPEADAICPMQMIRSGGHAIFTIQGRDGLCMTHLTYGDLEADLLRVDTAHFGLTMLRTASLAKMRKPWFRSQPDPNGSWHGPTPNTNPPVGGKTDEDVGFWCAFRDAGNVLYQANRVVVGHLQMMVTWPGEDLSPVYQHMHEYNQTGKPKVGVR
jgi:hypothetical protein